MNIATSYHKNFADAYRGIIDQFAGDASFLWLLRSIAVKQPHYTRADIQQLEQRIDAQINGLMTSLEESWPVCVEALELNDPGETFTAAVLAFRSHDVNKIHSAVKAGLSDDESAKGLVSALGWLAAKLVNGWIEKFFASKDLDHKYLAVAAASVRREDPGEALTRILQRDDCRQHEKLYARALRLIGELGRQDLTSLLDDGMQAEQEDVCFWSNHSAILLGNQAAVENIKSCVIAAGKYQQKAIAIAFRTLAVDQGQQWIKQLAEDSAQERAVIVATGTLGDPYAIDWLIAKMEQPHHCRLAAEAFTNITGIDLEQNQLTMEPPEDLAPQPNDDPDDDDVALDEDENLPWPDVDKVKTIWSNHGRNFISGQRYFLGRNINAELLEDKLINARQRQRQAAAMELALLDAGRPLANTHAKVAG